MPKLSSGGISRCVLAKRMERPESNVLRTGEVSQCLVSREVGSFSRRTGGEKYRLSLIFRSLSRFSGVYGGQCRASSRRPLLVSFATAASICRQSHTALQFLTAHFNQNSGQRRGRQSSICITVANSLVANPRGGHYHYSLRPPTFSPAASPLVIAAKAALCSSRRPAPVHVANNTTLRHQSTPRSLPSFSASNATLRRCERRRLSRPMPRSDVFCAALHRDRCRSSPGQKCRGITQHRTTSLPCDADQCFTTPSSCSHRIRAIQKR